MKRQSPIVCWILAVITSGIYSLYWLYNRSDVINEMSGNTNFQGKKMVKKILFSFVIVSVLMCLALYFDPNQVSNKEADDDLFSIFLWLTFFAAMFYTWSIIQAFYKAGYAIQTLEKKQDIENQCSPHLSWVLLFFLYFNIPYLQSHLNCLGGPQE